MEKFLLAAYFFVLFLFLGSFLNVVAFRTLEGTSVVNPKHSHCPSCGNRLVWKDLIPVLSWLLLGGKCRYCGQKISWLYPLGELATALILLFILLRGGFVLETFVTLVLFLFIVAVTLTDLRAKLIPNKIVFPGLVVLLVLRLFLHAEPLWSYGLGFLAGGALLTLLALVPNGMGGGDIKLFALLGLGLGWKLVLLAFFFACLWGTVIGLPLKIAGRVTRGQPIAFGPFILLGTLTAWAYGPSLLQWYMRLFF